MIEIEAFLDLHTHTRYPDNNNFPSDFKSSIYSPLYPLASLCCKILDWDDAVVFIQSEIEKSPEPDKRPVGNSM